MWIEDLMDETATKQNAQRVLGVLEFGGLERTHLYRKLKQLGVDLARSKRNAL